MSRKRPKAPNLRRKELPVSEPLRIPPASELVVTLRRKHRNGISTPWLSNDRADVLHHLDRLIALEERLVQIDVNIDVLEVLGNLLDEAGLRVTVDPERVEGACPSTTASWTPASASSSGS